MNNIKTYNDCYDYYRILHVILYPSLSNIFHLYINPRSLALRARSIPDFISYYIYYNILCKVISINFFLSILYSIILLNTKLFQSF